MSTRLYNDPAGGTGSTIGPQINIEHYHRKALIEAQRDQYFMQLASVREMPKNTGQRIVQYHYLPLLDDRNVNGEGIDASGATIANGNLWGSSKDVGVIASRFPTLGETGGRVNGVSFSRVEIEGSFNKFGIFRDYTQDSIDFDTDSDLEMHASREMVRGASEMSEDMLQIDLLSNAGVIRYPGAATSMATIGEDVITFRNLLRLHLDLSNNRTPLQTTMYTGTTKIDTRTIPGARVMYIGHELQPVFEAMVDLHGERAFIPVQKYAAGGTAMRGEIGTCAYFRIIVHPEMQQYAGAGAASTNPDYYTEGGNITVFPMLVVGEGSFTTIGFHSKGRDQKFSIIHKHPGKETADTTNPYGEMGFMSIRWFYGFMVLRSERLAVMYSAGQY